MAPPPAAGNGALVSTHTIPEEEQAQRYCCISLLTLLVPQSRLGDKLLEKWLVPGSNNFGVEEYLGKNKNKQIIIRHDN